MKIISVDELVNYKVLPFNIFDENGEIVLNAGDNLTPGKLLQLRYLNTLYYEENAKKLETILPQLHTQDYAMPQYNEDDPLDTVVNLKSSIAEDIQLKLKSDFKKAFLGLRLQPDNNSLRQVKKVRDKLLDDLMPVLNKTYKKSQLKIIGSYETYHGLNVALLTAMLAKKMNLQENAIADVTLAALLHDIGKTRLPKELQTSYSHSSQSNKMYELHPELGYKILKNELHLPDDVCKVALEHHEKNDGNGYPHHISSDLIHPYSQMVGICNLYDNIISGKSTIHVTTPQEAVKRIIELGTSWFSANTLFSFVYMTSYHDDVPIEELGKTGGSNWQ